MFCEGGVFVAKMGVSANRGMGVWVVLDVGAGVKVRIGVLVGASVCEGAQEVRIMDRRAINTIVLMISILNSVWINFLLIMCDLTEELSGAYPSGRWSGG